MKEQLTEKFSENAKNDSEISSLFLLWPKKKPVILGRCDDPEKKT